MAGNFRRLLRNMRKESEAKYQSFAVGDRVIACEDIYEHPTGDTPGGYCARRGDLLIVRRVGGALWPLHVSHEHRTDASFGVNESEVRKGGAT